MRRILQAAFAIAAAAIVTANPVHADEKRIRLTGIYSDMYYNQEGGDLLGTEIFIVQTSTGYRAVVQTAQGEAGSPIVVPVQVDRDTVRFRVTDEGVNDEYQGRISATGFDGTRRSRSAQAGVAAEQLHLKRKNSYWQ